ncbi:MAG TPA: dihydrofolate reductase [Alphaproteobacteria bacterium]
MTDRIIVSAIAAMSENRAIGREGALPWHIPEDLKYFKRMTLGKPVIMGRKTFESIGSKPLPKRLNIVISRSRLLADGIGWAATVEDAIKLAKKEAQATGQNEIMIVGGAQIYREAMPLTDRLYLTVIHRTVEGDAYFPDFDQSEWRETARDNHTEYSFVTMERK